MKQFITILLSLSLYAPHVAKLLAYADCSITMLSNSDPRLCDCNKIIDNDAIPPPTQPDKEKEISIKADWKYVAVASYRFGPNMAEITKTTAADISLFIPDQSLQSVFHPPKC